MYILQSLESGRYYIGVTANLEDRLKRHSAGRSKSTRSGGPWELRYKEEFTCRSEAMVRERELKSWKSRTRIERLIEIPETLKR
ncbi:MAG: GIY-YIG nuclease family protein [Candidatus Zixiibacteriota bacterium]